MKNLLRAALTAALLAVPAANVSAQTLEETLASAYRSNPLLAAERARLRQTEEGYFQARSAALPNVSGSITSQESERWGGGNDFNVRGSSGSGSYQLNVTQPIYRGGRTSGAIGAAEARIQAGRERLRSTEQSVLLDAVSAHANVVRDQQIVSIRNNNVEVLGEQLRAARDRFEVGEITRTDVAQAEARLSGARAQLSAAQAALAASRAAYARVAGVEAVAPQEAGYAPGVPSGLSDAAEAALSNNPDLMAVLYGEEAAEQNVRVARGALRPELAITGTVSESRDSDFTGQGQGSATVAARVTVPIFTGGLNRSRLREAQASVDEARMSSVSVRRQVVESVTNAWNNYLAAQAVIESTREAVRANEIAFEGVEQEAFVGLRTTLDVLDAEQELLNSRLELVRAQRDLTFASYALLQAMGLLDSQRLGLPVDHQDETARFEQSRWPNINLTPWN